jgi:hypothetical protein
LFMNPIRGTIGLSALLLHTNHITIATFHERTLHNFNLLAKSWNMLPGNRLTRRLDATIQTEPSSHSPQR